MIKILRWSENRFVPSDKIERHCLINVISPEKDELEKLTGEMLIPSDFLTDPLDIDERARIETENGFLLIVLRLPKYEEGSDIPFTTFPAGIILTKDDTIVIISSYDITDILNLSNGRSKGIADGKRSGVVLVFWFSVNWTFGSFVIHHHERRKVYAKEALQLHSRRESIDFKASPGRAYGGIRSVRRISASAEGFL